MYFSKAILLIIICLFINACNEKASTVSINNPPTYNGNQRQARLSVDNQAILVRALFEGVQAMTAPTLLSHHLEKTANDNVILTNINLERNCKISGKIKLTGTLDTNNRSGDLTLNYKQCYLKNSQLDGSILLELRGVDPITLTPNDLLMFYNELKQNLNGKNLTSSGVVRLVDETTTTQRLSINSSLFNHSLDGQQIMYQNLNFNQNLINQTITITGRFCEGINGCVAVSTLAALNNNYTQGQLLFTGVDKTQLKVNTNNNHIWLELDSNGDNLFETITQYN